MAKTAKIEEIKKAAARRKHILHLHKQGHTLKFIAESEGVSSARISQLLKQAKEDIAK